MYSHANFLLFTPVVDIDVQCFILIYGGTIKDQQFLNRCESHGLLGHKAAAGVSFGICFLSQSRVVCKQVMVDMVARGFMEGGGNSAIWKVLIHTTVYITMHIIIQITMRLLSGSQHHTTSLRDMPSVDLSSNISMDKSLDDTLFQVASVVAGSNGGDGVGLGNNHDGDGTGDYVPLLQ